jgi:cell division protein FtsL
MSTIEIHFEKNIKNVALVRELDVRQRHEYLFVTFLAAFFVLTLLFYGWQHYRYTNYGYRISEAQKKKIQLTEMRERLRMDRSELRDPQRIDQMARERLGMVAPIAGQWITLTGDTPLQIPLTPENSQPALTAEK